ncbi:carbohydrate kinase family protein [bacterium]|nr:carbohydrate kinase family protein [bacterium]
MNKKIITVGGATTDTFIKYEDSETLKISNKTGTRSFLLLEYGGKLEVKDLNYYTGGGGTNSAVSFSRLGFEASTICKVGKDSGGERILEKLRAEKVNTDHVVISEKGKSGRSFIIPSFESDRTIFAYRGITTSLQITDISEKLIKNNNFLYVTSLSGKSSKIFKTLVQKAKKLGLQVATNPGISQLRDGATTLADALKFVDIFILNSSEAKQFMRSLLENDYIQSSKSKEKCGLRKKDGPELFQSFTCYEDIHFNLGHFFKDILSRGPKTVVVTNGSEGVYVANKKNVFFCPSPDVNVVNTLGAGDAFGSCFSAQIFDGRTIEESITKGVINACSVIEYEDAKIGLLTKTELEKKFNKINTKLIQRSSLE